MDIAIQHPWFRRALGSVYPARLFDQFFGEGMFDYDLFPYTASTISPYYRQSLFRNFLDSSNSGISEVTRPDTGCFMLGSTSYFGYTCRQTYLFIGEKALAVSRHFIKVKWSLDRERLCSSLRINKKVFSDVQRVPKLILTSLKFHLLCL